MFTKIFRKINFLGALKTPLLRVFIIQTGNYTYLNFQNFNFSLYAEVILRLLKLGKQP